MTDHVRKTYEPCVLDSEGNCTRWSHDHASSNQVADGATHSSYPVRRKDDTWDASSDRVPCNNPTCIHADHPLDHVVHVDKHGTSWTDAIPKRAAERFKVETAPDGMPAIVEQRQEATRNRADDWVWATVKCSGGEIVHVKVPWSAVLEAREAERRL